MLCICIKHLMFLTPLVLMEKFIKMMHNEIFYHCFKVTANFVFLLCLFMCPTVWTCQFISYAAYFHSLDIILNYYFKDFLIRNILFSFCCSDVF